VEGRENFIMSKKISIHFWSIFNRYEEAKESPSSPQKRVTKDLLEKIDNAGAKVVVYSDNYPHSKIEGEGPVPSFQKELIKAAMEERMKQSDMPYDEVVIDKPKDVDLDIDYEITEHKNWEKVLLDKLKKNGD